MTILVLWVLTVAGLFWARFYQAVRLETFIAALEPGVSPAYLALTGLVFGIVAIPAALGLWFGKAWAPALARRLAAALAIYYWLDFLLFVVSDASRGSWPFAAGMTVLGLGWVFWSLSRPSAKLFFENLKN
ncbi:MAG TPA: hypothetical protein VMN57_03410 [Anaerolineales bacterium]|nr:hypothetical protein [Anaerolineales bacterium]